MFTRDDYLRIEKYVVLHNKHFGFYPPLVKMPDGAEVTFDDYEKFIGHVHKLPCPTVKTLISNVDEIFDALYELDKVEQFYALRALLDDMAQDTKKLLLHTKEFARWCSDNSEVLDELKRKEGL